MSSFVIMSYSSLCYSSISRIDSAFCDSCFFMAVLPAILLLTMLSSLRGVSYGSLTTNDFSTSAGSITTSESFVIKYYSFCDLLLVQLKLFLLAFNGGNKFALFPQLNIPGIIFLTLVTLYLYSYLVTNSRSKLSAAGTELLFINSLLANL